MTKPAPLCFRVTTLCLTKASSIYNPYSIFHSLKMLLKTFGGKVINNASFVESRHDFLNIYRSPNTLKSPPEDN